MLLAYAIKINIHGLVDLSCSTRENNMHGKFTDAGRRLLKLSCTPTQVRCIKFLLLLNQ